jgi:hypothetical protein
LTKSALYGTGDTMAYLPEEDVEPQTSVVNITDVEFDKEISVAVWHQEAMAMIRSDYDLSRLQQEVSQTISSWRPLPAFCPTENANPLDLENFINTLIRTAPSDMGKMNMCRYILRCNSVEELITFAKSVFFELLLPCMLPFFRTC